MKLHILVLSLHVEKTNIENENIEIYNILGEKVMETRVEGEKTVINMNFAPGVYLVRVRDNNYQIVVE